MLIDMPLMWFELAWLGFLPFLICALFLAIQRLDVSQVKGRAPGSSDQRSIDPANGSTGEANP